MVVRMATTHEVQWVQRWELFRKSDECKDGSHPENDKGVCGKPLWRGDAPMKSDGG